MLKAESRSKLSENGPENDILISVSQDPSSKCIEHFRGMIKSQIFFIHTYLADDGIHSDEDHSDIQS